MRLRTCKGSPKLSSGPNQHFIPKFVQKPFGILPKRKSIWYFERNTTAEEKRIKRVASGDNFYSDPSSDGEPNLDDKITEAETPLSSLLHRIRSLPVGAVVGAVEAAEIVTHLVPRTAHFRATIERGLRLIASGAVELFSDEDRLQAAIGLDQDVPTDRFREIATKELQNHHAITEIGIPISLLERIAFFMAKESFSTLVSDALPLFQAVFADWLNSSGEFVRDSHNKALSEMGQVNTRQQYLESLMWSVHAAPATGAILPDCVAVAILRDGSTAPAMAADWKDTGAFVMPISPHKLIVGVGADFAIPSDYDFNGEFARSSHDFFLAPCIDDETTRLHPLIGERSTAIIDDAVEGVLQPFLNAAPAPRDEDAPLYPLDVVGTRNESWQYELTFIDCGDSETVQPLIDTIQSIVAEIGNALPLHRLDGITIASDYRGALATLDRGYDGARTPETAPGEIGVGFAQTVSVFRSGQWKERIVIDSMIAFALIDAEKDTVEWGLYALINQLSDVAINETVDRTLPGIWMQPISDPLQSWLYQNIHPAIFGYIGSHFSAGFGDPPDLLKAKRDLFITTIEQMRSSVLAERLQYRFHGDVDRLLAVVMPAIRYTLQFGANLLGHCASTGSEPFDLEGMLAEALDHAGLKNWFSVYRDQLETLRRRFGRWDSFDEFLLLNVHVERLMWQLGILPWNGPEGIRIEVPLGTDNRGTHVRFGELSA